MENIGIKVGAYLKAKGISQTAVANAAGIARSTLSGYTKGKASMNAIVYYKICKFLEVPMEKFFEE